MTVTKSTWDRSLENNFRIAPICVRRAHHISIYYAIHITVWKCTAMNFNTYDGMCETVYALMIILGPIIDFILPKSSLSFISLMCLL